MDKKPAVCLIYEFLSEQGGLEREIINHARFFQDNGFSVKILTCHLDKNILDLLPFEGLKVEEISIIKTPFESFNLMFCMIGFNKMNKYNPDLFFSYSFPSNYIIRNKKSKKINYVNHYPHFIYLKNEELDEWKNSTQGVKREFAAFLGKIFNRYFIKLDKKLIKLCDLLFMNSKFTQGRLDKLYNTRSIVSYPPLDKAFSNVKPTIIKEKYIFSSSRIIPDKKYEWLIGSVSLMKNKLPIYLAGSVDKDYKIKLMKYSKEKKVVLKFLGRLKTNEIINYYASAQVFAFPTPREDFGLVPAESLSCGTPVVAWGDGAGPCEQIIDGENGYLAKPYELKDFALKLDLILNSNLKTKNKINIIKSSQIFSYDNIKLQFMKEINNII
ncbi:hypothetical protein COU57_06035 [Candidatus Pacearchaeota archaeon CG10_big_fil_rev_8_21_14_0_10_32_14]|nr:MAG: hypothetical protein COU57_06035 [Candidatus Pacearchaeota archaeon CG10_big_fil_rev_8_21_14_0_10_32_14]